MFTLHLYKIGKRIFSEVSRFIRFNICTVRCKCNPISRIIHWMFMYRVINTISNIYNSIYNSFSDLFKTIAIDIGTKLKHTFFNGYLISFFKLILENVKPIT